MRVPRVRMRSAQPPLARTGLRRYSQIWLRTTQPLTPARTSLHMYAEDGVKSTITALISHVSSLATESGRMQRI
jgi:hypothetical protein